MKKNGCNFILLTRWFIFWRKSLVLNAYKPPYSTWNDNGKLRIGVNLCPSKTPKDLALLIFQPEPDETIVHYPNRIRTWEHLAKWLGLFPSAGQARKAGFSGNISDGLTHKKLKQ